MEVIFYLPFLLLISFPTPPITSQTCGKLNSCDKLIPYFLFQKGACGRAARCFWELLHLEEKLLGGSSQKQTLEENIMKSLCNIPTLKAYADIRKDEDDTLEIYDPCGIPDPNPPPPPPPGPPSPTPPTPPEPPKPEKDYPAYPMTTFYTFTSTIGDLMYLERMKECAEDEYSCTKDLQNKIWDACEKLDDAKLKTVENSFRMRLRGKQFYKLVSLHDKKVQLRNPLSKCSLYHVQRFRKEDGTAGDVTDGEPTFDDGYGFNRIDPQLRGPFFDLYILYEAHMPGEWNETKAYQELAHYLPMDMIDSIHNAIKCVYDRTGAKELVWKPEKFCWNQSTFVCVELAQLKGNSCSLRGRDDTNSSLVPNYNPNKP